VNRRAFLRMVLAAAATLPAWPFSLRASPERGVCSRTVIRKASQWGPTELDYPEQVVFGDFFLQRGLSCDIGLAGTHIYDGKRWRRVEGPTQG